MTIPYSYPCIDVERTCMNLKNLRLKCGYEVKDLQDYFHFEYPQAIYKWERGECPPSLNNMMALSVLYGVPVEKIIVYCDEFGSRNDRDSGRIKPTENYLTSIRHYSIFSEDYKDGKAIAA